MFYMYMNIHFIFEYQHRGRDRQKIPAWSYQFEKVVAENAGSYELTLTSEMTSDPSSELIRYHIPHHVIRDLLDNNGTTKLHIFVDKNNKNFLLPKFKVDFEASKNGEKVLTIAVLVILITAPIGAIAIMSAGPKFLTQTDIRKSNSVTAT